MENGLHKDADTVMRGIRQLRLRLAEWFKNRFADLGLNLSQYSLLAVLEEAGESTMGELTRRLGLTMGAGTNLVDRLVHLGYVERRHDAKDRRLVKVRLTDKGAETLRSVLDFNRNTLGEVLGRFSAEDRALFIRIVHQLEERLAEL